MRPRTFFSAAIVRYSNTTRYSTRRLWFPVRRFALLRSKSVLDSNAFEVVAFQVAADGLRLILVETRKAGAIIRGAVLDGRLGERIGVGQQFQCLDLHHAELPQSLVLIRIGADLDDPAALRARLCGLRRSQRGIVQRGGRCGAR